MRSLAGQGDASTNVPSAERKTTQRMDAVSVSVLFPRRWGASPCVLTLSIILGVCARQAVSAPSVSPRHLVAETPRLLWLQACCAVAEGANVPLSGTVSFSLPHHACAPGVCVAAVLGDALHRVSVLGGRVCRGRSAACTAAR
jgi:hypothetical protein